MSKTLEGMARAACDADGCDGDYDKNPPEIREALATDMKRALLWLADQMEENGDAVKHCKLAAVSAYLERGQEGRGVVEPSRLMIAIAAALRAAGDGR